MVELPGATVGWLVSLPPPPPHMSLYQDEEHPQDIAYVYSGYAPLSVRLAQCALQVPITLVTSTCPCIRILARSPTLSPLGIHRPCCLVQPHWKQLDEQLKMLPGPLFEMTQPVPEPDPEPTQKRTPVATPLSGVPFSLSLLRSACSAFGCGVAGCCGLTWPVGVGR